MKTLDQQILEQHQRTMEKIKQQHKRSLNMIFMACCMALLLIVIFTISSLRSCAQPSLFKPSKKELISYGLYAASGSAKAFRDGSLDHRLSGSFWDNRISWKNKYKDFDAGDTRAAFPGSKTWLVSFTDGRHLMESLNVAFLATGTAVNIWDLRQEIQGMKPGKKILFILIKKIIYPTIVRTISFEFTYKNL
jgi:hypothetical protein